MATKAAVRWIMGVKVTFAAGSTLAVWVLDNRTWTFDPVESVLYLTRGQERKRICNAECLKIAVGFSVGAAEGLGERQTTALIKSLG